MAQLGGRFDPASIEADERGSFTPLPEGDYACEIIESELRETKTGGQMLRLTLEVKQGPHAGRRIWDNLNIVNRNADAEKIAHRTLKSICDAVGSGPIDDSEQLHFRPLTATVKIEPAQGQYEARNGVKRYKPLSGAGRAEPQRQQAPAPQPGHGGSVRPASRPWGNGAAARPIHGEPPF
jgi:hypothetical protein